MKENAESTTPEDPLFLVQDRANVSVTTAIRAAIGGSDYFSSVEIKGQRFIDSAIRSNNPSYVAIQEADRLWPKRPVDFLLSLGIGDTQGRDEMKFKNTAVDLMEGEFDEWFHIKILLRHSNQTDGDHYQLWKLNPDLSCKATLHDVDMIRKLTADVQNFLERTDRCVFLSCCAKLLASSFFLHLEGRQFFIRSKTIFPEATIQRIRKTSLTVRAATGEIVQSIDDQSFDGLKVDILSADMFPQFGQPFKIKLTLTMLFDEKEIICDIGGMPYEFNNLNF